MVTVYASVDRFHMAESVSDCVAADDFHVEVIKYRLQEISVYRRKHHDICLFVEIKSLMDVIVLTQREASL